MRPPWLTMRGWLLAGIPLAFTLGALAGCPKPGPTPVTPPDAADAAPVPAVTCDTACARVQLLGCVGAAACPRICARVVDPTFRACVASAQSCGAVTACDKE